MIQNLLTQIAKVELLRTHKKQSHRVLCQPIKSGVSEYSANLSKVESQSTLPTFQNLSHRVICQYISSNLQSALPTYQKWSYRVLCEHTKNGVPEYSANLPKVQLQSAL